jgi:hypothetical protein
VLHNLNRSAQAVARGAAQVLDRDVQAAARGTVCSASRKLDCGAQAVARGVARFCRRYLIVVPRPLPGAPLVLCIAGA